MSNTKHTPGPWQIDETDQVNYKNGIINIKQGAYLKYDSVCTIYPCRLSFEKSLANAKLIEAAPDMLEALQKIAELRHPDRSCSLEAQGYSEQECAVIANNDYAAGIAIEAIKKATE